MYRLLVGHIGPSGPANRVSIRKALLSTTSSQTTENLASASPIYVKEVYESWLQNPKSVHKFWSHYFKSEQPREIAGILETSAREIDDHLSLRDIIRACQASGHPVAQLNCLQMTGANMHGQAVRDSQDGPELVRSQQKLDESVDSAKSDDVNNIVDKNNKASPAQLNYIADHMAHHLPRFFSQPHPFNLYTRDVVFIDNLRSKRFQGMKEYAMQLALIKLYHNLRYSSRKVDLLNLVKLPEESCVKVRWRVVTKPGLLQYFLFFYKIHSLENWNDAISTFYVNKDGKIYCHVCDNIDVETNEIKIKKAVKNPLVSRGLNV